MVYAYLAILCLWCDFPLWFWLG